MEENLLMNEKTLTKKVNNKEICLPQEEKTINQYNKIVNYLKKKKFNRYEISNFALSNYECLHNKRYWDLSEYVGFGIAAHSFYNKTRIENQSSFDQYFNKFEKTSERVNNNQLFEEYVMLGLRTTRGIDLIYVKENFKIDLLKEKKEQIDFLVKNNLVKVEDNFLVINDSSFGVANQIILKLI